MQNFLAFLAALKNSTLKKEVSFVLCYKVSYLSILKALANEGFIYSFFICRDSNLVEIFPKTKSIIVKTASYKSILSYKKVKKMCCLNKQKDFLILTNKGVFTKRGALKKRQGGQILCFIEFKS